MTSPEAQTKVRTGFFFDSGQESFQVIMRSEVEGKVPATRAEQWVIDDFGDEVGNTGDIGCCTHWMRAPVLTLVPRAETVGCCPEDFSD
jgi:hypothetical protein